MSSDLHRALRPSWARQRAQGAALAAVRTGANPPREARGLGEGDGDAALLVAAAGAVPKTHLASALGLLRQCTERRAYQVIERLRQQDVLAFGSVADDRAASRFQVRDIVVPGLAWDAATDGLELPLRGQLPAFDPRHSGAHLLGMALLATACGPWRIATDAALLDAIEALPREERWSNRGAIYEDQHTGRAPNPRTDMPPGGLLGAVPSGGRDTGVATRPRLFVGPGACDLPFLLRALCRLGNHGPLAILVPGDVSLRALDGWADRLRRDMHRRSSRAHSAVTPLGGTTREGRTQFFAETRQACAVRPLTAAAHAALAANLWGLTAHRLHQLDRCS